MSGELFRLDGKQALITGAGSGIGEQIARLYARQGAEVVIADIDGAAGERVAGEIRADGGAARAVVLDVTDPDSVESVFDSVGTVDILVNNAGVGFVGSLLDTPLEDFERLHAVNVRGVFLCAKAAVRRMRERGAGGCIVNVASIVSKIGLADRFAYAATKGAVLTMTLSIARDYVADGIRCNCVCPARIHTPFVDGFIARNYPGREREMMETLSAAQPIGRMGDPAEVAYLALYLASAEAGFVTGAAYDIDGGVIGLR